MSALAAIHVAKKQLGLDEDTYRAVLVRVTGKDSTKAMSERERVAVVSEFRKQGFTPVSKGLQGPFAKKLQALWIAAWNLGIVRDKTDAAMLAFVKRQTGIDHTRFLLDGEDAARAIDALKGWMAREAKVDWRADRFLPEWTQSNGYRIATAQFAILRAADPRFAEFVELQHWLSRTRPGVSVATLSDRDWVEIMNILGHAVRKAVR